MLYAARHRLSVGENKQSMIKLESVTKTYTLGQQRIKAVDNVSLTIQPGEFVAIMGKSGCGKTTLIGLIGGLDRPDSGRISVDGKEICRLADADLTRYRRDQVGIVFQFFNLIPILTVAENVALPHSLQGKSEKEIQTRVQELLSAVDLVDRQTHYPHEISGGEMQRVAIARALINKPQLVLADEPTGNLDSRTGHQVMETMARLSERHRTTFILATHSSEAASYATRTLQMRDGTLSPAKEAEERKEIFTES
jgi:ABC-type lipoprotein export system ATPase subunit